MFLDGMDLTLDYISHTHKLGNEALDIQNNVLYHVCYI